MEEDLKKNPVYQFLLKARESFKKEGKFNDEDAKTLWSHYDADKNNSLDKAEFSVFILDYLAAIGFGSEISPNALKERTESFFSNLDTNKDGQVSYDEFMVMFNQKDDDD
eukprot:TRINITY_DN906_c0_g1_i1.p1 TRINITY_DN906_c0_g1~~TRINITY_DN906_c0_g1_i1.p1  ORF type:complete len:110 (-),score=16.74 TRINITY_DN906_c0_g1_i1:6-335(-)